MLRHTGRTMIFLAFASIAPLAHAQGTISPEKLALIRQLNDLLQVRNNATQISELLDNFFVEQLKQSFEATIAVDPSLTPTQKKRIIESFAARLDATNRKIRERVAQRIDFAAIAEEFQTEIYDQLFTTEELQALVAFYRSPVGQKIVTLTPRMAAEAVQKAQLKLWPQMDMVLRELLTEELKRYGIKGPPARTRD
ncbi:MAG: hypothetical protein C4334_04975 [Pyrinomonas sp.]|uniref:DUF2059 domain-containing protein n=1 Tax=Pyrinomonas sp. TaxID=2080306 RepID=UPI00332EB025